MMIPMGQRARVASRILARASVEQKTAALLRIADKISAEIDQILSSNREDLKKGIEAGLSESLLDRLALNVPRLEGIIADLRNVARLPDPVGENFDEAILPNGLRVSKRRVPLGVLAVIYEARPNVTIDVAALATKTGNAVILKGGSETLNTNRVLVEIIRSALVESNLPADAVQFVDDPDRARVQELLEMHQYVDMVIPRGGAGLHQFCRENSRIPVITGGIGICHLYVDETADLEAALEVIQNAKSQRPTVCNALDTTLIHQAVAREFIPRLVECLAESGVTFRADETTLGLLQNGHAGTRVLPAGPNDFDTEWLSLVLGLKVVQSLDEAIEHISIHSTGHSDGILTEDESNAGRFIDEVDSAAVYINASTRFTDGGQLGLGAEVAISTQRLHARGPMGLRELTTYKWVIRGENHIRV